jgi:hypothetical protein
MALALNLLQELLQKLPFLPFLRLLYGGLGRNFLQTRAWERAIGDAFCAR